MHRAFVSYVCFLFFVWFLAFCLCSFALVFLFVLLTGEALFIGVEVSGWVGGIPFLLFR